MVAIVFIGIVAVLGLLSIPPLWFIALTALGETTKLRARLAALEARVAKLQAPPERAAAAAPGEAKPAPARPAPVAAPPSAPPARPAARRESLEERVMRRWAVWLGGLALALGGVFLVKYSIEQGFFGPATRIAAGLILGLVLAAASEAARRHPLSAASLGAVPPDYVPPALAAAATIALFASLYAGYALYDLIPPGIAFPLLALVAFASAAASLLHGMVLAWLGLAGAYAVPALVATETPSVPRLLAYVLAVTAGSLWLVRWRDWPWLGWAAVAGSALWAAAALTFATTGDEAWLGLYLLLLAPLFLASAGEEGGAPHRDFVAWSGVGAATFLMLALALWASDDAMSLAFVWLLTALEAAIGARWPRFDRLAWLAALLQLMVLAFWVFEPGVSGEERLGQLLILPPSTALGSYLMTGALVAAIAGLGGFAMLWRAPRPQRWALASAATPLAVLAALYWRVEQLAQSLPWAAAGFLLAAAFLAATEYLAPLRARPGFTNALAAYALATTGALALALTLSLRLGWLSVALALQLPAMAWLYERTHVRVLRPAAAILGVVVLARLLLNPFVVDYDFGTTPIFNGLLYTYGIPAAAFALAALRFRRDAEDATAQLLEAGAVALAVALVTLEIRHLLGGGRIDAAHYGLLEQAVQTDAWLAMGYALLPRGDGPERLVRAVAWRALAGVAMVHLALSQCLVANPLLAREEVGDLPFFDVLLLAYALPAAFALLYERALRRRGLETLAATAGVAALALAFLYISLELRHLFHGPRLDLGGASDGEWYGYSAVWLAYGAALLAIGILWRRPRLRTAGLAVGAVVAVKVFAFDMAELTGLYRALSFIGLGASLVAIARLYQRMVRAAAPGP